MRYTTDDKHIIKWMWVKKYVEKRLLTMFLTEDKVLMRHKDTDQNISARSLTLLIFAVGWGILWSTTIRTRISDATVVNFSIKCCNPLKLYLLPGNIFRKWFASYFLFTREQLIIMWSPTANLIAVTTLLMTSGLHRFRRRFKKNTNYFYAVRISISLAILSEIVIQIGYLLLFTD